MPKIDNRVSVGTIIAVVIAVLSFSGSYAIFGKDSMDAKREVNQLRPQVTLNTNHRLSEDEHMSFEKKIEMFVTRNEWDKHINESNRTLEIISKDIKALLTQRGD